MSLRRVIGTIVGLWLAVVVVLVLLGGLRLLQARNLADSVRHESVVDLTNGRALNKLKQAHAKAAGAHALLSNAALVPVRFVPYVGRQLRSTISLSAAGANVTTTGADAVREGRRILDLPHQQGTDRVRQFRLLADLARRTDARLSHVRFGPSHNLAPPIAHGHDQFVDDVAKVRTGLAKGAAGAAAGADLLSGPRTYLVVAANNAEMRAGSGMFLSVGELHTGDGALHLSSMTTVSDVAVPPGVAIPDADFAARWGWLSPQTEWRNLMLSPRFAASAELATRMWQAAGHGPVDGVLSLDPFTLKAILQATGPVTVGGQPINADQVLGDLFHDQYAGVTFQSDQGTRHDELSGIAGAAVAALQSGSWSAPSLAQGLGTAARGRHVLAWSARPEEQRAWEAAGIDGSLRPDSLAVSILNRGGNKLDQYLHVHTALELRRAGSHTEGVLRVSLENKAPPGEAPYIDGPNPGLPGVNEGDYIGIVAVNLPGAASRGRFDGVGELVVAGADGPTRVIGTAIRLPRGGQQTLIARFDLPSAEQSLHVETAARVPSERWTAMGASWTDEGARTVSW